MGELLNEKEVARRLGLSVQTLRNWRHLRKGPAYVRVGSRAIRYKIEDLNHFIEKGRFHPGERESSWLKKMR